MHNFNPALWRPREMNLEANLVDIMNSGHPRINSDQNSKSVRKKKITIRIKQNTN